MLTLTPAYGRDYKSKKAAIADWKANKDFIIANIDNMYSGKPVSRQNLVDSNVSTKVMIRYRKLQSVTLAD